MDWNISTQYYKHVPLRLIVRQDYHMKKAKRFVINETNQNVWVPNKHLSDNGTINRNHNLNYIFRNSYRKLELAKVEQEIKEINYFT